MKKYLFSLIVISSIVFLLASCGNSSSNNSAEGEENINIQFGHDQPESNVRHEAAEKFKDIVEEESDGSITVEIYPNASLGSEPENIENVSLDNIEMALAGTSVYTQYDSKMGAVSLPYLFDDYEHAWKVLDGEVGDMVSEPLLDDNIRILSFFENGMRQITNSKKPIENSKDLQGMTIRTPEGDVAVDTFDAMGASATPMSFDELYTALQQGTVDGQENPIANISSADFQEVQEYLSLTSHQYDALPLAVSNEFWESLSEEQQDIIQEASEEAADFHRKSVKEDEKEQIEALEDEGMKVNEPADDLFEKESEKVIDDYSNKTGDDFMEKFLDEIEEAK